MSNIPNFAKLVPGFDFLENLAKNAGSALPSIGQWVAPTLNPDELRKRIDELKTVQFWLEQNAKMLGTTIQALEVQRMTLSTLKTMNVQMSDLREAMKIPTVPGVDTEAMMQATRAAMGGVGMPAKPAPAAETPPAAPAEPAPPAEAPAAAAGVVDPMQWWNALTKQFTQLATSAMADTAADATRNFAGGMLKPATDAAAAAKPAAAKRSAARPASKKRAAAAVKTRAR